MSQFGLAVHGEPNDEERAEIERRKAEIRDENAAAWQAGGKIYARGSSALKRPVRDPQLWRRRTSRFQSE